MKLLSLSCMAFISCSVVEVVASSRNLTLSLLDGTHCLDGSMAGYYFNAAPGGSSDSWVIFMQGGGACATQADCDQRAQTTLGSSKDWPRSGDLPDNVLSSDCTKNPIWCNANRVYVPYCTGDVHIGGRAEASAATWGLYFSGRVNFAAIVDSLKAQHGLGDANTALLSGCSAGAIGAFHSVDFLAEHLPSTNVRGAPQAGWFFPNISVFPAWEKDEYVPPYDPKTAGLYNSSGSLSARCQADYGESSYLCFSEDVAFKYLTSLVHVGENAADSQQIYGELGVPLNPTDPATKKLVVEYISYYQRQMLASVQQIEGLINGGVKHALWMPACFDHCGDIDMAHDSLLVQGHTYAESLNSWWRGDGSIKPYLVAECAAKQDFPCSLHCDTTPPSMESTTDMSNLHLDSFPDVVTAGIVQDIQPKTAPSVGAGGRPTDGTVGAQCDTWYDSQQHGPSWRNVKNYGATGDGKTDDTAALLKALTEGRSSKFTTSLHATVYFPPGTYVISGELNMYFDTAVYGNWKCRPVILLANGSNPQYAMSATSDPTGEHTGNFYHMLQNIVLRMDQNSGSATGIHWAVSQGSNIHNVTIYAGSHPAGIFIENGSPTQIDGLEIIGGVIPASIGSQQYHLMGLKLTGNQYTTGPCLQLIWNWYTVVQNSHFSNCGVGIEFVGGAVTSLAVIDSSFTDVTTGISSDFPATVRGILLDRVNATKVTNVATGLSGNPSGGKFVQAWKQGYFFESGKSVGSNSGTFTPARPNEPLPYFARPVLDGKIANVLDEGAKGDGVADDTAAFLKAIASGADVIFVPFGRYMLSSTVELPAGVSMVGDGQALLLADAKAPAFLDASNPTPMLSTAPGYEGSVQDLMLATSTNGDVLGCIMFQWQGKEGSAFVHDVYYRMYGGAWAQLLVTPGSGGYFSSMWGWVADHDIDTGVTLTVKSPRGFVANGAKGLTLYGVAYEHSFQSQFNITNSENVNIVAAQTESPYWQAPPTAFGISISNCKSVYLAGGGFYNWFNGIQAQLVEVSGCQDTHLFANNVVGCDDLLDGDHSISNQTSAAGKTFSAYFLGDSPY